MDTSKLETLTTESHCWSSKIWYPIPAQYPSPGYDQAGYYLNNNRVNGDSHGGPRQGRQRQKRQLHGVYYTDLYRRQNIANGSEGKPPSNRRKERQLMEKKERG